MYERDGIQKTGDEMHDLIGQRLSQGHVRTERRTAPNDGRRRAACRPDWLQRERERPPSADGAGELRQCHERRWSGVALRQMWDLAGLTIVWEDLGFEFAIFECWKMRRR